jgi:hypothetical protein
MIPPTVCVIVPEGILPERDCVAPLRVHAVLVCTLQL